MMEKAFVINRKTSNLEYTYIGRGTAFGNEIKMMNSTKAERQRVIEEFIVHFDHQVSILGSRINIEFNRLLARMLRTDKTLNLGCSCKPRDCHGDHIAMRLNQEYNRRKGYSSIREIVIPEYEPVIKRSKLIKRRD